MKLNGLIPPLSNRTKREVKRKASSWSSYAWVPSANAQQETLTPHRNWLEPSTYMVYVIPLWIPVPDSSPGRNSSGLPSAWPSLPTAVR